MFLQIEFANKTLSAVLAGELDLFQVMKFNMFLQVKLRSVFAIAAVNHAAVKDEPVFADCRVVHLSINNLIKHKLVKLAIKLGVHDKIGTEVTEI